MKNFLLKLRAAAGAVALAALALLPSEAALAQIVTQLPAPINPNAITDFGNGPMEIRVALGNAWLFTAQGSSTATGGASAQPNLTVALNLNPAPCVGCIVSGVGVTSGTTVVSYTPGTGVIVLSANLTATATGNVYSFGTACPPFINGLPSPNIALQPGGLDIPLFTQARVCGYAANGPGAQILVFPIGAH